MEEAIGPVQTSFTHKSMNDILQTLQQNRRINPGFNNFRPLEEVPQGGNPYQSNPSQGSTCNGQEKNATPAGGIL